MQPVPVVSGTLLLETGMGERRVEIAGGQACEIRVPTADVERLILEEITVDPCGLWCESIASKDD